MQAQSAEIERLKHHNKCFKETIDYLEDQLKDTKDDLNKASNTLMQSFNGVASKGPGFRTNQFE